MALTKQLSRAAASGDLAAVRELVEKRKATIDPSSYDPEAERPAWLALTNGRRDVLGYLLDKGADPEALWSNAAHSGQIELLQTLFDLGLRPGKGFLGFIPHYGTAHGTALEQAVIDGHPAAVTLLLEHGVDPNQTFGNLPPLGEAAARGDLALTRLLLAAGADPLAHDGAALAGTARGLELGRDEERALECLELLYATVRFDIDAMYPRETLLTLASEHGQLLIVKWLLGMGADPNKAGTGYGNATPIGMAAKKCQFDVVRELLRHPLNQDQCVAALLGTGFHKRRAILELFVEHGTPTDAPEVQKLLEQSGVLMRGQAVTPCDTTSVARLFATLVPRPGGPDQMELLTRRGAIEAGRTMREIGGLALPLVHLPNADLVALRPIFGKPISAWPVVLAAHDGNMPRTIAPRLSRLVPAWFAEELDDAKLQRKSAALHHFFGGEPKTLMMTKAALRREIAGSPDHNPSAARQLKARFTKASAKELEAFLFERDWYYDLEQSEKVLPLLEVAARLVASPPSRAWLRSPRGHATAEWVAAGERYDGAAHVALAASSRQADSSAFALYHTAAMFSFACDESVTPKLMAAARRSGSQDAQVKAALALC
jgi:ankyrin repeat protein